MFESLGEASTVQWASPIEMDRTAQTKVRFACFIMWIFVVFVCQYVFVIFEVVPDAMQPCEQIMDPLFGCSWLT